MSIATRSPVQPKSARQLAAEFDAKVEGVRPRLDAALQTVANNVALAVTAHFEEMTAALARPYSSQDFQERIEIPESAFEVAGAREFWGLDFMGKADAAVKAGLAALGFTVVSLEHRSQGSAQYPAYVELVLRDPVLQQQVTQESSPWRALWNWLSDDAFAPSRSEGWADTD